LATRIATENYLSALQQAFVINVAAKQGFPKKANQMRRGWFQLLRACKLAGKLAVIECCYCS
jgi:hypothetical protein